MLMDSRAAALLTAGDALDGVWTRAGRWRRLGAYRGRHRQNGRCVGLPAYEIQPSADLCVPPFDGPAQ